MTDTRSRVQAGVPTGGEFAREQRGENDDLHAPVRTVQEMMSDLANDPVMPLVEHGDIDAAFYTEENIEALDRLKAAGVHGPLHLYSYQNTPIGEWSAASKLPDGNYLIFTKHRSPTAVIKVETRDHPTDSFYAGGTGGMEGEAGGATLEHVVNRVLFEDSMVRELRQEFPFTSISFNGGRYLDPRVRIWDIDNQDTAVQFRLGGLDGRTWVPEDESREAEEWARAAKAAHTTQAKLQGALNKAATNGWSSPNRLWAFQGRGVDPVRFQ